METQEYKQDEKPSNVITGAHIAPKGHGAGCPCCIPPEDDED